MKKNIIKKSALYSMLLGLLACNSLMSMDHKSIAERTSFGINYQGTNDEDYDSRNKEGVLLPVDGFVGGFSLMQGLLTPQPKNMYYVLNIITTLQTLKMAWDAGKLRSLINKDKTVSSAIISYAGPLLFNTSLYFLGFYAGDSLTKQIKGPSSKFLKFGWYSAWLVFSFIFTKNNLYESNAEDMYLYKLKRSNNISEIDEQFENIVEILKKDEKNSEKLLERLANKGLFINQFFGIALKKNNSDILNLVINYYKKNQEQVLYSPYIFIETLNWNEKEIFDELLEIIEDAYQKNKVKYAFALIDTFFAVVNASIKHIYDIEGLNRPTRSIGYPLQTDNDKKIIYTFLENFFEVIQRMGYNPHTLKSKEAYTPIINFLNCYEEAFDQNTGTDKAVPNNFLEKVIHYFIEIGVPIYENKNACSFTYANNNFVRPIMNRFIPLAIDMAANNPEIQEYFKLTDLYNKQLLNVLDNVSDLEDLERFITQLSKEEQEAIFKVAATRGHMKTLTLLGKFDDKYKLVEATKLATKRRLTPIVLKYCISLVDDNKAIESIEKTLSKKDKTFFIDCKKKFDDNKNMQLNSLQEIFTSTDDHQLKEIIKIIQPIMQNAHPTKFNAMVNEFRKKE